MFLYFLLFGSHRTLKWLPSFILLVVIFFTECVEPIGFCLCFYARFYFYRAEPTSNGFLKKYIGICWIAGFLFLLKCFFSLSSLRKPVQSDELKRILKIIYCKCYFSAIFMPLWLKIFSFKFLVISCLKFSGNWDDVSVNSVCRVMMYLQRLYLPLWTLSSWSLHPSVCRKQDIYYQHLFHFIQSCQLLAVEAYSSLLVLEK